MAIQKPGRCRWGGRSGCPKRAVPGLSKRYCRGHHDQSLGEGRRLREQRKKDGLCTRCGEQAVAGTVCFLHWVRRIASVTVGCNGAGAVLTSLWERQRGRCAYTGELLIPGHNASLDHKMPTSRGGDHSIDNLQWVSSLINRMKTDMTHEEFLSMCRRIMERN